MLDGTLRYTVGGDHPRPAARATSMGTPRGVPHAFSNPHAVDARALVVNTPDIGPAAFPRRRGDRRNAGGPPDRARLASTMQRYGLTPVAPA